MPVIVGLSNEHREVLNTTILEAAPDHRYEMVGDSIYPLFLSFVVGLTITGAIFDPWAWIIGAGLSLVALIPWFWSGTEREKQEEDRRQKKAPRFKVAAVLVPGQQSL